MSKESVVAPWSDPITAASFISLKYALQLEMRGMRRRGKSALAISKQRTGLKTNDRSAHVAYITALLEGRVHSGDAQEKAS
jgi:hypothetical protein